MDLLATRSFMAKILCYWNCWEKCLNQTKSNKALPYEGSSPSMLLMSSFTVDGLCWLNRVSIMDMCFTISYFFLR